VSFRSWELHSSTQLLHSNIPQTALVATLDTYDYIFRFRSGGLIFSQGVGGEGEPTPYQHPVAMYEPHRPTLNLAWPYAHVWYIVVGSCTLRRACLNSGTQMTHFWHSTSPFWMEALWFLFYDILTLKFLTVYFSTTAQCWDLVATLSDSQRLVDSNWTEHLLTKSHNLFYLYHVLCTVICLMSRSSS
jgi:hypothetical protein